MIKSVSLSGVVPLGFRSCCRICSACACFFLCHGVDPLSRLSISRSFGPGGGLRMLAMRPCGVRLAGGGRLPRLVGGGRIGAVGASRPATPEGGPVHLPLHRSHILDLLPCIHSCLRVRRR